MTSRHKRPILAVNLPCDFRDPFEKRSRGEIYATKHLPGSSLMIIPKPDHRWLGCFFVHTVLIFVDSIFSARNHSSVYTMLSPVLHPCPGIRPQNIPFITFWGVMQNEGQRLPSDNSIVIMSCIVKKEKRVGMMMKCAICVTVRHARPSGVKGTAAAGGLDFLGSHFHFHSRETLRRP